MAHTDTTNPRCPDFSSHSQNAFDQLFPAGRPDTTNMTHDEKIAIDEAVDAIAEAEYIDCEGHE